MLARRPWSLPIHLLRVLLVAVILLLIHQQHQRLQSQRPDSADWSAALAEVQQVQPEVTAVSETESGLAELTDAAGKLQGFAFRTSPETDHIVGFSGPTDVLVLLTSDRSVSAVTVLSSGDTRDHVQTILEDRDFLNSLIGLPFPALQNPPRADVVSGATLTSLAILEAIRYRVATIAEPDQPVPAVASLRFPDPPRLTDVQLLYPEAADVRQQSEQTHLWQAVDDAGQPLGTLLRFSPAADNLVGYQGPTDALASIDDQNRITGVAIGISYDNEPYVGYVREDTYFRSLFHDRSLTELATGEIDVVQIEGVSGATMTSQNVAAGLKLAAEMHLQAQQRAAAAAANPVDDSPERQSVLSGMLTLRNLSTVGLISLGIILGLTHLRGNRRLRLAFQLLMIVWLGLINGDMVSQALLLGWTRHGIPWQTAGGLTFLTAAAFLVPLTSGHNVYCSHICPHGAVQQLIRNRLPWRLRLSPKIQQGLKLLPAGLLLWVVLIGLLRLPFSAVDIEPFDAWLWTIAGAATIAVAVVGLVASLFVPMAYCRFGCPTGALLEYVRFGSVTTLHARDVLAILAVLGGAGLLLI